MSLDSALNAGRAAQQSRMTDTFDIGVATDNYAPNPTTGIDEQVIEPLFTTPGYFARGTRSTQATEAGGRTILETPSELRIPWDADAVPPDAIAVCTEIGPSSPPRLLGRRVRVDGSGGDGSQRTHYPLEVTEVLS